MHSELPRGVHESGGDLQREVEEASQCSRYNGTEAVSTDAYILYMSCLMKTFLVKVFYYTPSSSFATRAAQI